MTVAAVVVAGGSGLRAGGEIPKQYQLIGGKPMIRWTLEAFLSHPSIHHVLAVIGNDHDDLFRSATLGLSLPPHIIGGTSRQESCRIGVEACADFSPAKILIHDAARPFISHDVISRVIAALDDSSAVIPGLPIADTIKFAPTGIIEKTIDRSAMWFVQTPQGFTYSDIRDAHRRAVRENQTSFTDDAAVAEFVNLPVHIITGDVMNKKLTTAADVAHADRTVTASQYAERPDVRTGHGIDFHVFEKGNAVTLCGISIPHSHKLKGHSDADVAMHALTDAIFGAIGEADIGVHFPPTEKQWKGAASAIFLQKATDLLAARNGILANVDITILAEAPRIAPHLIAMKTNLASLLSITVDRIAIKATTTEKMGAIGRKEGMAAYATVTVRLPL